MAAIPNLPGYASRSRGQPQKKKQNFVYVNGYAVEKPPKAVGDTNGLDRYAELAAQKKAIQDNPQKAFRPGGKGSLPKWLANDRQVLQFSAYFKEAVQESDAENFRIRKCVVFYFLADGSVEITESKRENSGIPQGKFIKRHRIPFRDNQSGEERDINLGDLQIGKNIPIYGRTFHIFDCNASTREHLTSKGFKVAPAEVLEDDDYSAKRNATMARETGGDGEVFRGVKMNPMKSFMEAKLGKTRQKDLKEFLKNDGCVLRFYCQWDDRAKLYGDLHKYTLHYFLADHTMEILEIHEANSGHDSFPKLLGKGKLPKSGRKVQRGDEDNAALFVRWEDLTIGMALNVYGRQVQVLSCDETTRAHYAKNGKFLPDDMPFIVEKKMAVAKTEPPPHNGFGSEEDSAGSYTSLVPKKPKKNYEKMLGNDGKNLKFSAKLDSTSNAADRHRTFVITYYLSDDSISVFEPQQRNSGIVGGKFLKRQRLKNSRGQYLGAADFFVGAKVTLGGFNFTISDIDEFSLKYMEQNREMFPMANIKVILQKVTRKLLSRGADLHKTFAEIDRDGSGTINLDELQGALDQFFTQSELTRQEVLTVMRFFDAEKTGRINYEDFKAKVQDPSMANNSGFFESGPGNYGQVVQGAEYDDLEKKDTVASVNHFRQQLSRYPGRVSQMLQAFRLADMELSNRLSSGQVQSIIQDTVQLGAQDARRVMKAFFRGSPSVDYRSFENALTGN